MWYAAVIKIILFSNVFFLFYLVIYATYLLIANLYGNVQMYHYRKLERLNNILNQDFAAPMSIIVPAYNEELTILTTIENLLKLDYRNYEIVIVDDGSKDTTKQKVVDTYHLNREVDRPIRYAVPCKEIKEVYSGVFNQVPIILVSKENGGRKADASNAGINVCSYPFVVDMDADEILQKDALIYASRAILEGENVIGVGGNVKIANGVMFNGAMPVSARLGDNLVADMQVMEYSRSFLGSRIFHNAFNGNLIISGGYGVFRKNALIEVGGYSNDSLGEDMDLTMKLHYYYRKNKIPYQMKYVPDSICWTQAPFDLKSLKKQRQRWHCGLIQTIWKYRSMLFNPKYGFIGMVAMPYSVFYELYCPFFILLGWFVIIASTVLHLINPVYALYVFVLYVIFGVLLSMVAFGNKELLVHDITSKSDTWKAIGLAFLDALFFRPYLFIIEFFAFFKYKKLKKSWVSPARTSFKSQIQ